MSVYTLNWHIEDENDQCFVYGFGRDSSGKCVTLKSHYMPYVYVCAEKGLNHFQQTVIEAYSWDIYESATFTPCVRKSIYGFQNGRERECLLVRFPSIVAMKYFCNAITGFTNANPNDTPEETQKKDRYKQVQGHIKGTHGRVEIFNNVEPLLQLLHERGITSVGWVNYSDK